MPIGRSEEFHYLCLGALDETFPTFEAGSQQMGAGRQESSKFDPLSYLLTAREHLRGPCCVLYCPECMWSHLLCIGHNNKPTQGAAVTQSSLPLTLFWQRNGLVALLRSKQTTIDLIGLSTSLPLSLIHTYININKVYIVKRYINSNGIVKV